MPGHHTVSETVFKYRADWEALLAEGGLELALRTALNDGARSFSCANDKMQRGYEARRIVLALAKVGLTAWPEGADPKALPRRAWGEILLADGLSGVITEALACAGRDRRSLTMTNDVRLVRACLAVISRIPGSPLEQVNQEPAAAPAP